MASVVSICNLALSNLGKDNINDLSEKSAEARACKQFYDHVRDTLLQAYPWRFAGKTASLPQIANDKPGQWAFAYSRPVDCLKIRWVRPQYSINEPRCETVQDELRHGHNTEAETIYCNLSPAFLHYTFKIVDPARFPPLFIDALSWHLSTRLAMPLTRDLKVRNDHYQMAVSLAGAAAVVDANEVRETSDHDSELIAERG